MTLAELLASSAPLMGSPLPCLALQTPTTPRNDGHVKARNRNAASSCLESASSPLAHPAHQAGPTFPHELTTDTLLDTQTEVLRILDEVLSLGGRALRFDSATPLLGAIPELDSMAVVTLITTLEERFGIMVDDDEISGDTFASVGSLRGFVDGKLSG